MRPRPALLLGALIAPALPLVAAAPAHAASNDICVNMPADANCDVRFTTTTMPNALSTAIGVANGDLVDSRIKIGPGEYSADGPYLLNGSSEPLEVVGNNNGAGPNGTTIVATGAAPFVTVDSATLRNVRIEMSGANGVGLRVTDGATADRVIVVDRAGVTGATGIVAEGSTVQDSTVNLQPGTGSTGYRQLSGTATLSRVTMRATDTGVVVQAGTLAIDNALVELETGGQTGIRAGTGASTGTVRVDARQVTVVGGAAGSRGVWSNAAAAGVTSVVTLANSIVRGPATSVAATTAGGTAANLNVHHSDFQSQDGTVTETGGGNLDQDPQFLNPAANDYSLRAGSPVVDRGDPGVTTTVDREGNPRVVGAAPDMGAYELQVPKTIFTSGPSGLINQRQPVFHFRSETATSYECRVDLGSWQACTSPATTAPLADGAHTFAVRAKNAAGAVEDPPATRTFTVDATAPNARITKKPAKRFFKKRIKFKFASSEPGTKFQCKLDRGAWRACRATYRFNVKVGKHVIRVRAVDKAGNVDPSPAKYKYRRLKRR